MSAEHTVEVPAPALNEENLLGRIANIVRARPLAAFFVLAFAFSWWPSIIVLATGSGPPILGCGPFLAAVAVLALTSGKRGVKALFHSMLRWRVGLRWWAVALLTPVVLSTLATALNVALGAPMPTSEELATWTNIIPTALIILLVPLIGGAWEEPGWRGYALPRLLAARSALAASLVLGGLWAVWHVPLFLTGEQHWSDLLLVVVATVVFTWLFENALRSVLIAMVLHAMNNAVSGEYFSQMFTGDDSARQSWLLVLTWGVAATFVVFLSRRFRTAR